MISDRMNLFCLLILLIACCTLSASAVWKTSSLGGIGRGCRNPDRIRSNKKLASDRAEA